MAGAVWLSVGGAESDVCTHETCVMGAACDTVCTHETCGGGGGGAGAGGGAGGGRLADGKDRAVAVQAPYAYGGAGGGPGSGAAGITSRRDAAAAW
jgi:hypothetical protein